MRSIVTIVVCIFIYSLASAQQRTFKEVDVEQIAEEIIALQDLDLNYEDLYENLLQILYNPLDINSASASELRSIFILSELNINALIEYRENYGPFISIYELQSIPGYDNSLIYRLLPFLQVRDANLHQRKLPGRILHSQNRYLISRYERTIQTRRGYTTEATPSGTYAGSPDKLYQRFRAFEANDYSIGFTLEKDAGEQMRWSPPQKYYGFDFVSGHAMVQNQSVIKTLMIGDFQMQSGQGLVFGGGFGIGKGAETILSIRRPNRGIIPYTSVNESGFFRGLAAQIKVLPSVDVTLLYSNQLQDISLQNDSVASSILISGLHRTPNELNNRKRLTERNMGMIISHQKKNFEAGLSLLHTHFSIPIQRVERRYNYYAFNGDENLTAGAFLNYNISGVSFFSEAARSSSGGKGIVAGVLSSIGSKTESALLLRIYDANFHSLYAQALSENTLAQNEKGVYWGFKQNVSNKFFYSGYVDIFSFPWLRSRAFAPGNGHEYLLRAVYRPSKETQVFIMFREEAKARNTNQLENTYVLEEGIKRNLILNADYGINRKLSLRTRIQFSDFDIASSHTQGMTIVQDLNYKYRRFNFSFRHALFDTDDFENRQYVYERDVLYAFSLPAYSGRGLRNYAMVHFKPFRNFDCWIRYARSMYTDRDFIGSGADRIEGNIRSDIKLQTRWIF